MKELHVHSGCAFVSAADMPLAGGLTGGNDSYDDLNTERGAIQYWDAAHVMKWAKEYLPDSTEKYSSCTRHGGALSTAFAAGKEY